MKLKMFVISCLIVLLSGTLTYTYGLGMIVHDPSHTIETISGFAKTLQGLRENVVAVKDFHKYSIFRDGRWMDPLQMTDPQVKIASIGQEVVRLGWGNSSPFGEKADMRLIEAALQDLQKIVEGKSGNHGKLRDTLETIYGDVPVTRTGAAVEGSYRDMAASAAHVDEVKKAVDELRQNADEYKAKIESGQLTPGDIERYSLIEHHFRMRAQALELQNQNYNNQMMMRMLGLQAGETATREQRRLQNVEMNQQMMGVVRFSPKRLPGN